MNDKKPVAFLNEPRYITIKSCSSCPFLDEGDCDLTENRVYKRDIIPLWCPLPKKENL